MQFISNESMMMTIFMSHMTVSICLFVSLLNALP